MTPPVLPRTASPPTGGLCLDARQAGAVGDGRTDDTAALQRALDRLACAGGGTLRLGSGCTFVCGPLRFGSFTEMHLEPGSRLQAITDPARYADAGTPVEGTNGIPWLRADKAARLSFTGSGTIDGRGRDFMAAEGRHIFQPKQGRPTVLHLEDCRHVTIRDLTIEDAPFWTVHLLGCEHVDIHGIRILNNLRYPNNDGINPDRCRHVRIRHCHIEAGDDAVCLKSMGLFPQYGACEDVLVSHCTLMSTSAALKLGTDSHGDIRRVRFEDCVIRGSGRGIALVMRDGGLMEDIAAKNLRIETRFFHEAWWGAAEPIYVSVSTRSSGQNPGMIRNVHFENIHCRSENGVYIGGPPVHPARIDNIRLKDVNVELVRTTRYPRDNVDLRPTSERPERLPIRTESFMIRHAGRIEMTLPADEEDTCGFRPKQRAEANP